MGLKFQASHRGLVLLAPSPHPETIQGLTQGRLIRTKGSPVTQEMTTGSGVRRRIQSQRPIYFLLFHVCQHHLLNPLSFLHSFLFFFFLILFIYLFLAALGLRCCTRAFSSCDQRGLLFVGVRGLLIAVASLVAEHGL